MMTSAMVFGFDGFSGMNCLNRWRCSKCPWSILSSLSKLSVRSVLFLEKRLWVGRLVESGRLLGNSKPSPVDVLGTAEGSGV